MRILVTGWFSFEHGEATVGDLRAAEVACGWLDDAGLPYELATSPAFGHGVTWWEVDPGDYTHLLFVCGPAHGDQLDALLDHFSTCRRVAVDVSLTPGHRPDFDVVLERDSLRAARPDLAIASAREPLPLVGVVRAHDQPEYGRAFGHEEAHDALDRVLDAEGVALVNLDTRVDPRETGRRTCAQVEAAIAGVDVVATTRLHGLVVALKGGVPAVAIDPVRGGGKVTAQAAALQWPYVYGLDDLRVEKVQQGLRACLQPEAHQLAVSCRDRAARDVHRLGDELVRSLTGRGGDAG